MREEVEPQVHESFVGPSQMTRDAGSESRLPQCHCTRPELRPGQVSRDLETIYYPDRSKIKRTTYRWGHL